MRRCCRAVSAKNATGVGVVETENVPAENQAGSGASSSTGSGSPAASSPASVAGSNPRVAVGLLVGAAAVGVAGML